MLAGVTGHDHPAILEAGQLEQFDHVIKADGPGFIQDNHRTGRKPGLRVWIGQQFLQRHGLSQVGHLFAERVRSGSSRSTENGIITPVAERARQFDQGGAFAGTGQAAKAGETVGAGEDMSQHLALVGTEAVGRFVTVGDGRNRLDARCSTLRIR